MRNNRPNKKPSRQSVSSSSPQHQDDLSKESYAQAACGIAGIAMLCFNESNTIEWSNAEALKLLGQEGLHDHSSVLPIEHWKMLDDCFKTGQPQKMFWPTDRKAYQVHYRRKVIHPASERVFAYFVDVTELIKANEETMHQLLHHELTGLPNRLYFNERIESVFPAKKAHYRLALMLIDLDNFKPINDTYGHDKGDEVLIEVAKRLELAAVKDFVAHIGGDEFGAVVFLPRRFSDQECQSRLAKIAERMIQEINKPIPIEGIETPCRVGLSIGIAMDSPQTTSRSEVLKRADAAMYRAKHGGRNRYEFDDPDAAANSERPAPSNGSH